MEENMNEWRERKECGKGKQWRKRKLVEEEERNGREGERKGDYEEKTGQSERMEKRVNEGERE